MRSLVVIAGLLVLAAADVARADCRSGCDVCPRESGPVVAVDAEIVRREGGTVHAIAVRAWGPAAEHIPAGTEIAFDIYAMSDLYSAAQQGNRVFVAAGWPDGPLQQPDWQALPFDAERDWVECYSFPEGGLALDEALGLVLSDDCLAAQVDTGWDSSCNDTPSACSAGGGDATWLALFAAAACCVAWRRGRR
jgi:hypothetical protein